MDGAARPARSTACLRGFRKWIALRLPGLQVSVFSPMAAAGTASVALTEREKSLCNGINPWLAPVAMVLTQDVALKGFFGGGLRVLGRENLPHEGPVLLAPTHRSRWDALMLPYAAGRRVSGRDCRFMVTSDEMTGLQG